MASKTYYELQQTKNGFSKASSTAIAEVIKDRYDLFLDMTRGQRAQWRMNGLFVRGFQWAFLNSSTNDVVLPPLPKNRRHVVINTIKPWALDTEAKLDITTPSFEVTPNSLDQEDKDAAVGGEGAGMHFWRHLQIRQHYREGVVRKCSQFGNCLAESPWDPSIGPQFRQQLGDGSTELLVMGDLRFKVFDPWDWFCDEMPGSLDEKPYVCLLSWMSLDKINNFWPDGDIDTGEPVTDEAFRRPMDDVSQILAQAYGSGKDMHRVDTRSQGALVYKWYMKPQHSAENGLIVYMAGGKILQREEWPSAYAELEGYPMQDYHWYTHPGQFRGTAPVEDQIGLQREINKTASQIRENMDAMLALKWMNPIGSGVETLDDIAGQIVDYMPGFMPTVAQAMPIPAHAFRYLAELFIMMEDVQMLHKPSKGKVPAGVKSGVGIELLQEQDDRPLSVPEAGLHLALSKQFKKILQIASRAIDEPRMIEISGANKRRQVIAFKGADLRNNTDIHLSVVGGSTKSKPAIVRKMLDMVQLGMFRDEGTGRIDTRRIMEIIRFAIPDAIYEHEDTHEQIAHDENDLLWGSGPAPIPQIWEDHFLHLRVLEADMNTIKWKQQAQSDPAWAQRWVAHRMGHIQFILQATPNVNPAEQSSGNGSASRAPARSEDSA